MRPKEFWHFLRARVSTYEPAVVVAFLVTSLAGFLFLQLTSEMLEGETRGFDEAILRALRDPQDLGSPIGPAWLTKALTDLTSLGGVTVLTLITSLAVIYLLLIRK
ncbi:MAG: hypothetical protein JWL86_6486, partial [Rhizobium sp.]|nr:hypothetical protein [Rhizobium sp.]